MMGIQETFLTEDTHEVRYGLCQKNLTWHTGSRGISGFHEKSRADIECLQGFSVNDECTQILVYRLISVDLVVVFAYLPQDQAPTGWKLCGI